MTTFTLPAGTESLDSLNDQAWTKIHQFLIEGETVNFKVNNGAKV